MAELKKQRPIRSYSGIMWTTNPTNKKHLREDFNHRCAYCDDLDRINNGYRSYHVEHFAPKDKFPSLKYEYSNLLYACPYCNGAKSDKWPSDDATINVVGVEGFLDPCKDEYYEHLHRNEDGSIGYDSELGKYIYKELNLGLKRHKVLYRMNEIEEQLYKLEEKRKGKSRKGENTTGIEELEEKLSFLLWKVGNTLPE